MKELLTCLLATLGLTTACAKQNFENADVQEFAELIADTNVVVLDVRSAAEFAEGHIQRAILIDQGQSDFVEKAKATLPTDIRLLSIAAAVVVLPMLPEDWLMSVISASI